MQRSIVALKEFVDLMGQRGVSEYLAGATAVVREASNGDQFLDMVREQTGLGVRVLSGSEEAQLSLLGVSSIIPSSETPVAIFDIGGGSTELICKSPQEGSAVESLSTPVGVVHLTETFLREDPPESNSCAELRQHVSGILHRLTLPGTLQDILWVGTAGTVTTLASMHLGLREYDPGLINGTVLRRSWLLELCNDLAKMPIAERKKIRGLEPGREDIILAGALVTLELMDTFDFSEFTVSDAGLLEGLFLELCQSLEATADFRL